ncbi:MAG TPA: response regulator [Ignavibacteriaceae bacterium]|nr:response regulator [Ignavibacteriaceae bacterium]
MRLKLKFEFRITLIYLLIGFLWILFSDRLLEIGTNNPYSLTRLQTYKGWFYVSATGCLLYYFIKRHLIKLRSAEQKAKESDRLKTVFIQNISHEIRTPMNGIIGFSELLKDPDLDEDQKAKYINLLSKSSDQLLNIVNGLLDISLIESGNQKINNREFPLNNVMDELFETARPSIKEGITFSVKKGLNDSDSKIIADDVRIKQVLINLLNNANKYIEEGEIIFGYELKGADIEFFVKDTGIGIDSNNQQKVFDRFYKADTDGDRLFEGLGLGLSICKAISGMLGGQIWLESEPGKGSVFYFSVPYVPVIKHPPRKARNIKKENALGEMTILVADDDEPSLRYITEILNRKGIRVITVSNGIDAVKSCRENKINVILLDLKMPGMSGYDAIKQIKAICPDIPAIAQTAYAMSMDRDEALSAGFNDYLAKPFSKEELIETISKYKKN